MTSLIPLFVILAGIGIPVQVAANHRLREAVQSPVLAVLIAFVIGAVALGVALLVEWRGRSVSWSGVPWWAWIGGPLSAFAVCTSVVGFEQGGAGLVSAFTVCGQLTAAVLLDHFGWLGAHRTPVTGWRIASVALLSVGAILMQRK